MDEDVSIERNMDEDISIEREVGHGDRKAVVSMEEFLLLKHEDEIVDMLLSENSDCHFSVHVNALDLFDYSLCLSTELVNAPNIYLQMFDQALRNTQSHVQNKYETSQSNLTIKENCHVRISNLPVCPELVRDKLPKSKDAGHFLSVTGTVIRCSLTKLLEYEREYMCVKCRFIFPVDAEIEQNYELAKPQQCPSINGCNSTKFTPVDESSKGPSKCRDYQELKIQEQVQKLKVGNIPRSITALLENDLVDKCKPGDDVTITGTVLRRWKNVYIDSKCEVELILKANDVLISNDQRSTVTLTDQLREEFESFWRKYKNNPLQGRNEILSCFCPQVFGLYIVKLAVSLVLIGGVQRIKETGTRLRGESHLLLVGDPGTGKSQFLKYSAKLMPRSVLTTGIGSTTAGLTVTAVKDSGEWQLEAGALVLADGGICCIDEFNSIREHDKTSIHEAMEQQTISVAKAGLVCKLNTRTTILAATNPKGRYDKDESVSINIALASPLLSRFDIVLVLVDNQSEEWDRIVSSFILKKRQLTKTSSSMWNLERMQCYFACAKSRNVQLTPHAEKILRTYYHKQRAGHERNLARTTLRLLESTIRIAEAHARLMYRDEATVQDAIVAVSLIEASMQNTALLPDNMNPLRSSFPEDPDKQYIEEARIILRKLGLHEILSEVEHLEKHRLETIANIQKDRDIADRTRNESTNKTNNVTRTGIEASSVLEKTGNESTNIGATTGNGSTNNVEKTGKESINTLEKTGNELTNDLEETQNKALNNSEMAENNLTDIFQLSGEDFLNVDDADLSLSPEICGNSSKRKKNCSLTAKNNFIDDSNSEYSHDGHVTGDATTTNDILERVEQNSNSLSKTDSFSQHSSKTLTPTQMVTTKSRDQDFNLFFRKPFDEAVSSDYVIDTSTDLLEEVIRKRQSNKVTITSQNEENLLSILEDDGDDWYGVAECNGDKSACFQSKSVEATPGCQNLKNIEKLSERNSSLENRKDLLIFSPRNKLKRIADSTMQLNESGLVRQAIEFGTSESGVVRQANELSTSEGRIENKLKRFKFRKK